MIVFEVNFLLEEFADADTQTRDNAEQQKDEWDNVLGDELAGESVFNTRSVTSWALLEAGKPVQEFQVRGLITARTLIN